MDTSDVCRSSPGGPKKGKAPSTEAVILLIEMARAIRKAC